MRGFIIYRRNIIPYFNFENTQTGDIWTESMTISEKETYLENNPHIIQTLAPLPTINSTGNLINKTDGGWREMLGRIKKGNRKSSIDSGNISQI